MQTALLTVYVLMWPALVAVVLLIISRAFLREWAQSRRAGRDII